MRTPKRFKFTGRKSQEPEIMPLFYFSRLKVSDRKLIKSNLHWIPKTERKDICREYERLYMAPEDQFQGRTDANAYLYKMSLKYYKPPAEEAI